MLDPISIGASVLGEGLSLANTFRTQRDVDKALGLQIKNRARIQDEIDARLLSEIGGLRGLTPEDERAAAMSEFVSQLRAARAAQPGQLGARGTTLSREASGLSDLRADLGQFAGREADITSRIDAPRRMREKEGLGIARAGTDIRQLVNRMGSQEFLDQLRVARKAKRNPLLDLGASLLKGFGSARSLTGGGGSAPLNTAADAAAGLPPIL